MAAGDTRTLCPLQKCSGVCSCVEIGLNFQEEERQRLRTEKQEGQENGKLLGAEEPPQNVGTQGFGLS